MRFRKAFFIGAISLVTFCTWLGANPTLDEPVWLGRIAGFAYSPMQPGQSPDRDLFPSEEEIAADLAIIAEHADSVRTYSLDGTLAAIPRLAAEFDLEVTAGVWLDENLAANQARLTDLRLALAQNRNITQVVLGNETLLTGRLNPASLMAYLSAMRAELEVPVSTAEPWHIWLAYPELAEHVDFLTVHLLPYWEGISADHGVEFVHARIAELEQAFPDLPIVVGEIGWPSNGRQRDAAVASAEHAETFLRRFLSGAEALGHHYFLMEAFDQPWKRADEGEVGAYWGLFNGARENKYALGQPLIGTPKWRTLAALAAGIASLCFLLLTVGSSGMRWPGLALLASAAVVVANAGVLSLNDYLQQYWTIGGIVAAAVLLTGIAGMVVMIFIEAHEWAEANFGRRRRTASIAAPRTDRRLPKVSIHVPAYSEPPAMLIETLDALNALDYPDYEVIVIDNNTDDERLWRPVEACCDRLGPRFRFFHVAPLEGFKAGALNFALERTAADAEIVAVIDSDYRVDPNWLSSLVHHFDSPKVALVQAPQDYRDQASHGFKRLCEAEYRGFFRIGMVTRNERNAIIQHGTMTMIRTRVLREVGAWAEWTVTEDAELGLRILEHGYEAVYTTASFGRGLTPDRFRDYRAQRFRWALGATQILRRHGRRLLGLEPSRLSLGQRFHFLTGWTAWLGDGLNLVFNLIAVAWSALMAFAPLEFLPPISTFTSFVLALFAFKLVKMICLYRSQVRASALETLAAVAAGLSLVFIVGRAVLSGLLGNDARFVRTPKLADRDSALGALCSVAPEALLAIALLGSAFAVSITAPFESADRTLWTVLLITFSIPHLAAVSLSLLSALPGLESPGSAAQLDAPATDARQS